MITYGQALRRIAERTVENRENWKRSLTQRRTGNNAIYGIPYYDEVSGNNKKFECHISILPNLEYYTRFQFKLYVDSNGASIDPYQFTFEIGDAEVEDGNTTHPDLVDITDYLMEQQNEWVDGTGYFPTTSFGIDEEYMDFYDILDVCCLKWASNDIDDVKKILEPGNKLVRISSPTPCRVTWIPYLDYSTVNR